MNREWGSFNFHNFYQKGWNGFRYKQKQKWKLKEMQKNNALLKSKAIGSAVITSGGVLLMFSRGWQLFSIGGQTYLNYTSLWENISTQHQFAWCPALNETLANEAVKCDTHQMSLRDVFSQITRLCFVWLLYHPQSRLSSPSLLTCTVVHYALCIMRFA